MYYYIVDPQGIDQRSFERVQNQLYSSLTDLKISGEITRTTPLRPIASLVNEALTRGANTIVAVGHDSTVQEIVNAVGEKDVTVGYVPLGNGDLAEIIGAGDIATSCKNLAQRRVAALDLGKINASYFFTFVSINASLESIRPRSFFDFNKMGEVAKLTPRKILIKVDEMYEAEFECTIGIIVNSRAGRRTIDSQEHSALANPTDGLLDILLLPKLSSLDAWKYRKEIAAGELERVPGCAVMHGRDMMVEGDSDLGLYIGERAVAKSQAHFSILPSKIRMIVGRDRTF